MSIKDLYVNFNLTAHQISRYIFFKKNYKHRREVLCEHNIPLKKISKEQKLEIEKVWGKTDYDTHELIYSITGDFNPYYCSQLVFGSELEFALNNDIYKMAWSDKNYFDLFFPAVTFPHTIIRNVSGSFYDHGYNHINESEVLAVLAKYDKVVFKPSLDTGMGTGVKLVTVDDSISDVLKAYKKDYLIQEVLEQYEPIKAFNPSSVNIIRLNSLFLNGKVSYLSSTLRVGAEGAFNDNSTNSDGRGMSIIGITEDGCLKDHAIYPCGEHITTLPNGASFAGFRIPNFEKAKKLAAEMHSRMPFAKYIGFDIAFDKAGEPVIMEYNINAPGVFYYQLANGPLFGDRTDEVIDTFLRKGKK